MIFFMQCGLWFVGKFLSCFTRFIFHWQRRRNSRTSGCSSEFSSDQVRSGERQSAFPYRSAVSRAVTGDRTCMFQMIPSSRTYSVVTLETAAVDVQYFNP
jgi:hypothetical protein